MRVKSAVLTGQSHAPAPDYTHSGTSTSRYVHCLWQVIMLALRSSLRMLLSCRLRAGQSAPLPFNCKDMSGAISPFGSGSKCMETACDQGWTW